MSSSRYPPFDASTGACWIYPSSDKFAMREYQVSICREALFTNTLVCLPTGLGKTLIAAVVMYNFYRWFPTGKVVFLAPTRPLVNQQVVACQSVMGIPEEHVAHLEGTVAATKREVLWGEKRVFFCTPQTMLNDLSAGRLLAKEVVCLVIDEAHRATGNYAYTQVVHELASRSDRFRVLALSATPGSDAKKVQSVLTHLQIAHIELRAEDDPEVLPYTHQRQMEVVVCEQGAYSGIQSARRAVNVLLQVPLDCLAQAGVMGSVAAVTLNLFHIQDAEQ
jgi:Fanconi anemia group M protein